MQTEQARPKSRRWLWYFMAVGLVAIVLMGWFYLFVQEQLEPGRQLKMEQLVAARKRWEERKITDYQMLYTVQRGGDRDKDRFFVEVRGGKVRSVVLNGQGLPWSPQLESHSMSGLFNDIERFLKMDEQPGARQTFCRGFFDVEDGHLVLFVRRVVGGPERVEIKVEEFRPTPAN